MYMNTRSKNTKLYVERFFYNYSKKGGAEGDETNETNETNPNTENDIDLPLKIEDNIEPVPEIQSEFARQDTYIFEPTSEQYTIENEQLLSKDIQFLEPGKTYTVRMCIYSAVLTGVSPYLKYYIKKDIDDDGNPIIKFPEYTFVYNEGQEEGEGQGEEEEEGEGQGEGEEREREKEKEKEKEKENQFMGGYPEEEGMEDLESDIMDKIELTQQLVNIFSFAMCSDENCGKNLKGIYRLEKDIEDKKDVFYIVFDATKIITDVSLPIEIETCVIYEILATKQMGFISFDYSVSDLFKEIVDKNDTLDFHHLKSSSGEYAPSPYCLFMCTEKEASSNEGVQSGLEVAAAGLVAEGVLGDEEKEGEEPVVEEPTVEEPTVEEPVVEPIVQEPIVEEPIVQEPIVQEPIVEEPTVENPLQQEQETQTQLMTGGSRTLYNVFESDKELITYPKINHDKIGYYTFFSLYPVEKEEDIIEDKKLQRFLVFADEPTTKLLTVEKDETDKLENLYNEDPEALEKYTFITFFEDDRQLWCVKSQKYFITV